MVFKRRRPQQHVRYYRSRKYKRLRGRHITINSGIRYHPKRRFNYGALQIHNKPFYNVNEIIVTPSLIDNADTSNLSSWDWSKLLQHHPQLVNKVDTSKLSGDNWSSIIREQPQLIDGADISKFSGKDWSWILSKQPQLINQADTSKFSSEDWSWVLQNQPQLKKVLPIYQALGNS